MIASFRDPWLEEFYRHDVAGKGIPANLTKSLFRRIRLLDAATCEADLMVPPGNRFERLKGNLAGWCSIRVNEKWRLIFEFDAAGGKAERVYLDPHDYRG